MILLGKGPFSCLSITELERKIDTQTKENVGDTNAPKEMTHWGMLGHTNIGTEVAPLMDFKLMILCAVFPAVASGRLPSIALTLLVSDVLLDTSFDPNTLAPPPEDRLLEILRGEEDKFKQMQRQGSLGRTIKVGPAAEEEATLLQSGQRQSSRDWVNVDGEAGNPNDPLGELTQTVGGIFGGVSSMFMNPFSMFGKGRVSSATSSPMAIGSPQSGSWKEGSPRAKDSDCPSIPLTSDTICISI